MRKIYFLLFLILAKLSVPAQWNPNVAVNLEVAGVNAADMQTAFTADGKTWIAFFNQVGSNYVMRAQLLDINGNKLLGPNGVVVNDKPTGSATFVFNVTVDAAGNLIIAAQDQRTSGTNMAVIHKIAQDGTALWGTDGIVLGAGLAPYPAVLSTGEVVVGWSESTANTLSLQKITTAGTLAWTTPIQVRVGTTRTSRGQIIGGSGGSFTVVFQRAGVGVSTTLYAQRYKNDGSTFWTAPVQLSNQTTSGARYYSLLAENDTTYFGYYASQGSRFNSWVQRINADGTLPYGINGTAFNTSTAPTDPYQQTTNIALTPGSPYIWSVCSFSNTLQSQYGIFVQKFLKSTGERQLSATGKQVYPIAATMEQQTGQLSLFNDTPAFMFYDKDYKIYSTRLDANGDFVWPGNRVELSTTTATLAVPKGRFGFIYNTVNNLMVGTWYENRGTEYRPYAQSITPAGLIALRVTTVGSVPANITTNAGTLPLLATIYPTSAAQNVTWSIVPVTGAATVSSTGVVTAQADGKVWAKATAVADSKIKDSILVTITNQTVVPVKLTVVTQNNVAPLITAANPSLQMAAVFTPTNTTFQNVSWHVTPATGNATISASGLFSALDDGTVWAVAVSVQYPSLKDSMLITIEGQRDNRLTGLIAYPIPTANVIHFRLLRNHEPVQLRIMDMLGRVVYSEALPANALRQEKTVDLTRMAPGGYHVTFYGAGVDKRFQIVKVP